MEGSCNSLIYGTIQHLSGINEGTTKTSTFRPQGSDLNPTPSKYEATVLTIRLWHPVDLLSHTFCGRCVQWHPSKFAWLADQSKSLRSVLLLVCVRVCACVRKYSFAVTSNSHLFTSIKIFVKTVIVSKALPGEVIHFFVFRECCVCWVRSGNTQVSTLKKPQKFPSTSFSVQYR